MTGRPNGPTAATWWYRDGEPGWYVVNRTTEIAVAGPFVRVRAAMADKQRRDERWPDNRDDLEVREVRRVREVHSPSTSA